MPTADPNSYANLIAYLQAPQSGSLLQGLPDNIQNLPLITAPGGSQWGGWPAILPGTTPALPAPMPMPTLPPNFLPTSPNFQFPQAPAAPPPASAVDPGRFAASIPQGAQPAQLPGIAPGFTPPRTSASFAASQALESARQQGIGAGGLNRGPAAAGGYNQVSTQGGAPARAGGAAGSPGAYSSARPASLAESRQNDRRV